MNARLKMHQEVQQPPRSIGAILIDSGRLRSQDAELILKYQNEHQLRFGDAARKLNFITDDDIRFALSHQFDHEFVDPQTSTLSRELIAAYWPERPSVDGLRVLRSQLMLRWFDNPARPRKSLALVGVEQHSGRSTLLANLAIVFSQLGQRTLLIDANMRTPRQHQLFSLDNTYGLSGLLTERSGNQTIQHVPGISSLSVLPAGAMPPNPHELLARPQFSRLIDEVSVTYDVVLVDTPAAEKFGDAQTVAACTRGALIACTRNVSSSRKVQLLAQLFQQSGIHVIGSVLDEGHSEGRAA